MTVRANCTLNIDRAGPFAFKDGTWSLRSLNPPVSPQQCVLAKFDVVSSQIDAFTQLIIEQPTLANNYRLFVDLKTFGSAWQGCTHFIESQLLEIGYSSVTTPPSRLCYNTSDSSDPCCSRELGWTSCCAPRILELPRMKSFLGPNLTATEAICSNPECVYPILQEYA